MQEGWVPPSRWLEPEVGRDHLKVWLSVSKQSGVCPREGVLYGSGRAWGEGRQAEFKAFGP